MASNLIKIQQLDLNVDSDSSNDDDDNKKNKNKKKEIEKEEKDKKIEEKNDEILYENYVYKLSNSNKLLQFF